MQRVIPIMNEILQEKGLVTSIMKGEVSYYNAADPDKILEYIERKKEELSIARGYVSY